MPVGISYRAMLAAAGSSAAADAYIVNSLSPPVVADFAGVLNSGTEYYRVGGSDSTFDSMFTFSRDGDATMVDSDGNLKWAPHNLNTYSNDFNNAAWSKSNCSVASGQTDPDGNSSAWKLTPNTSSTTHFVFQNVGNKTLTHTYKVFAKAAGYDFIAILLDVTTDGCYYNLSTGALGTKLGSGTASITDVGSGWYLCEYTGTRDSNTNFIVLAAQADNTASFAGDGTSGVNIFGAHHFRAFAPALGGMVDNPDRGDSYVPTTSAAVYQARRNNHRFNGSTYDNNGILLEGEARTNLITSSDDMSGWTTSNMTVAKNQTGADGVANSAHSLTATSGSATVLTTITAASNPHVYSALVKRITGTGTIEMTVNGGTNWIDVTSLINSSEFIQVGTGAGTTVTNPQVGFRITTSGDAIAVQVNQLEQTSGQFSSPIPTSGATMTRASETLQIDSDAWSPSTTAMSYHWQGTLDHYDDDQTASLFSITESSANWLGLDIYTNLTRTGLLTFHGDYSNSYVGSSTTDNYLPQGKGTSINAAARMSSTVWQLAEGGTALTDAGRSSPTPNYTGSPIILGYGSSIITGKRYSNQRIAMFRQWAADIGDTGIESATS